MASSSEHVPSWDGDPQTFETFVTAAKWFEMSLKDSERKLAASRVWQRLSGPAKSVVRYLDPSEFDTASGLKKLIDILRNSPLQKLPIPDSFSRLERWSQLKRGPNETIPQLIVREEDLFTELQRALQRAREERGVPTKDASAGSGRPERPPSTSPTRSPTTVPGFDGGVDDEDGERLTEGPSPTAGASTASGFFEDELRGYRLLKASKLSTAERQHILTLTKNSTHFQAIRRALRTLFSEEDVAMMGANRQRTAWWNSYDDEGEYENWENGHHEAYFQDYWQDQGWDDDWHSAYWAADEDYGCDDWSPSHDTYWEESTVSGYDETVNEDMQNIPEDIKTQYHEAYALANESNRTLQEARAAVAKARASRGYFAPESTTGKGISGKNASFGSKGSGSDACLTCGKTGHHYTQCPDRFSPASSPKGKSKFGGKGKGFKGFQKGKKGSKGKFKSKGKGKGSYYMDVNLHEINVLAHVDQEIGWNSPSKALIDTGATESVAGVASMSRFLDASKCSYQVALGDQPAFRFGDGQSLRATSRIDVQTPALKKMSIYVLDGTACDTPILIGAKDLNARNAKIDYHAKVMMWSNHDEIGCNYAAPLHKLSSLHLAVDLVVPSNRCVISGEDEEYEPSEDEESRDPHDDGHGGGDGSRIKKRKNQDGRGGTGTPPSLEPGVEGAASGISGRGGVHHHQYAARDTEEKNEPNANAPDVVNYVTSEVHLHLKHPHEDTPELPTSPDQESIREAVPEMSCCHCQVRRIVQRDVRKKSQLHEDLDHSCGSCGEPRVDEKCEESFQHSVSTVFVMESHHQPHDESLDYGVRERVAHLAQRLSRLRDGIRNSSATSSLDGSPSRRVSMLRETFGQAKEQSALNMGDMPTLRSSSPVHEQGQERGHLPVSRTGSRDPSSSLDRVGEHLCTIGCEREDCSGQVHGDSGSTSFGHRARQVGGESQGQRGEGSSIACHAQDGGEEEPVSTADDHDKVRGGQRWILESCEQPASGGGDTNCPSKGNSSKGTSGWPVSMGEKIGNLWSSLQSLRHRMGTQEKGCQFKHDTDTTILNTCTTTNSDGEAMSGRKLEIAMFAYVMVILMS